MYAFVILVAIACMAWAFYVIFFQQVAEQQVGTDDYSFPQANDDGTLSLASRNGGSVSVYNFYDDPGTSDIGDDNYVLYNTNDDSLSLGYQIVYFSMDQSFVISLTESPWRDLRPQAEQAFLRALNISQSDACNLKVSVTIPYNVDPEYAGEDLGLSFCPNAKSI